MRTVIINEDDYLEQFLSIQAQDFIEDVQNLMKAREDGEFLSIQAQDFIEDSASRARHEKAPHS